MDGTDLHQTARSYYHIINPFSPLPLSTSPSRPSPFALRPSPLSISVQKRIIHLLIPNRGFRSVPGINDKIIRQSE